MASLVTVYLEQKGRSYLIKTHIMWHIILKSALIVLKTTCTWYHSVSSLLGGCKLEPSTSKQCNISEKFGVIHAVTHASAVFPRLKK